MIRDFFEHSSTYDYCPAEESAPRRISNKQFKKTCPPCLGEALRRGSIVYITIFMVFGANTLFMPVSSEPNFFYFINPETGWFISCVRRYELIQSIIPRILDFLNSPKFKLPRNPAIENNSITTWLPVSSNQSPYPGCFTWLKI